MFRGEDFMTKTEVIASVAGDLYATEQALESFPEAYRKGSLDRQVDVNGGEIQIKF